MVEMYLAMFQEFRSAIYSWLKYAPLCLEEYLFKLKIHYIIAPQGYCTDVELKVWNASKGALHRMSIYLVSECIQKLTLKSAVVSVAPSCPFFYLLE